MPRSAGLARWEARIAEARTTPPAWIRDADRAIPVVSITGTNGKSTVTRLITHILVAGRTGGSARRRRTASSSTSGWSIPATGPGRAARSQILGRSDLDVAVLETARGGLVLRGMGYESNEVSVVTNVTSDHLDLQGIHTLPELAEVKSTVARVTKPDGWCVLNADDPLVAADRAPGPRRRSRSSRSSPAWLGGGPAARGGRRARLRRATTAGSSSSTAEGDRRSSRSARIPITIGGLARHNVANALAAAGAARGLGASIERGRRRPRRLPADVGSVAGPAEPVSGSGADRHRRLRPQRGRRRGGARRGRGHRRRRRGRAAPVTAIVGTAGDRPDDTLRGIARIAATRAQRVVIKETLKYLRGRSRESVVGEMLAGRQGGRACRPSDVPIYESETAALEASWPTPDSRPRVIVLHVPRGAGRGLRAAREARREADRRRERADVAGAAPPGAPTQALILTDRCLAASSGAVGPPAAAGMEERPMEIAVGIALIIIAALEIIWIIRTVIANTPYVR